MKYKCIIFDSDGVLVDSEAISSRIWLKMVNEIGLGIDMGFIRKNFPGRAMSVTLRLIEEMLGRPLPENFEQEFRRRTYEAFKKELQPVPGIRELLDRLTIPFCVASSGPEEKVRLNLTVTGLIDKFEGRIISSYNLGTWKPDPGIFLHAADKMGFLPKDCAVVEDSLSGVKAALAGGFDVYLYTGGSNRYDVTGMDVKVFDDMGKLYALLEQS